MMERCSSVEKDLATLKELENLKQYSIGLKDQFENLEECRRDAEEEKHAQSVWNLNPPLHNAMDKRKFNKYDFLCMIGAQPEAKNVYRVNPVEHQMKSF